MKKILLSILLGSSLIPATAQWISDPATNNAVTTASPTTVKNGNVAVSDGAGGMYLAWIDSRISSNQSIYVQRILPNGNNAFVSEVVASQAAGTNSSSKSSLSITPDGAGGVLLVWHDARNTTAAPVNGNNDIYGQRINASGDVLWATDGVRLSVSDNSISNKINPSIAAINATEAMVVFGDNRDGSVDVYAQKVSLATGLAQWPQDLSLHGAQPNTQSSISILEDEEGGAFVLWQDPRVATTNSNIFMQRVNNAGTLLWGANGTVICDAPNNQLAPVMVSDGAGGVAITWTDNRASLADGDIYAQRINGAGEVQWAANGTPVCIQVGTNQSFSNIIPGGSGFIVVWSDPRVALSNRNIYINSIDALTGAAVWTDAATGGVAVCTATGNQPGSTVQSGVYLLSDGSNGAYVIWDDARAGSALQDIFAQRISSTGVPLWATDGLIVSSATANQQTPVAVNDLANNAIVAWRDGRSGTGNSQIFATQILQAGVLPVSFTSISGSLNAEDIARINWETVSEINADQYFLQRSNNGVDFFTVANLDAKNQATNSYSVIDNKRVVGTVFYRVQSIDKAGLIQYSETVKLTANSKDVFVQLYPNPIKDIANIEFNNIKTGTYLIRIFDSKGAVVQQQQLRLQEGFSRLGLNLANLSGGAYYLQLVGDDKKTISTIPLQKQ